MFTLTVLTKDGERHVVDDFLWHGLPFVEGKATHTAQPSVVVGVVSCL